MRVQNQQTNFNGAKQVKMVKEAFNCFPSTNLIKSDFKYNRYNGIETQEVDSLQDFFQSIADKMKFPGIKKNVWEYVEKLKKIAK